MHRHLTFVALMICLLLSACGPDQSSNPTVEDEIISELAGSWTGSMGTITINFNLSSDCRLNEVCGDFSIPEGGMSGDISLVSQDSHLYEFKATNLTSGEPSCATYEYLELLPDQTLKYHSEGCADNPIEAILHKVGNGENDGDVTPAATNQPTPA